MTKSHHVEKWSHLVWTTSRRFLLVLLQDVKERMEDFHFGRRHDFKVSDRHDLKFSDCFPMSARIYIASHIIQIQDVGSWQDRNNQTIPLANGRDDSLTPFKGKSTKRVVTLRAKKQKEKEDKEKKNA
jgi:hypothetical protein